ncbi:succinate dehydrogenase, hydrophobic membrane anchor protein (plasmid) [Rhizobium acidisoli]|uniref:Succinate dehydrogenase hydrophobic membrane anchor subunit n=1 Tax=Rhizobium acidisoli TaxID=1538158 RepID=A0AAE6C5D9_9HYPH|nr:succinate dehydrogenase, hydrophobic membrane anchor protein [Rhizobium acidisoli]KPH04842.1 succinate dehydrogenase [Rhizobium acidisoli]QAS83247.1 succinate dehydrogenase, hydrophobic membrane anchor protein [Rhizobium acidisoli]
MTTPLGRVRGLGSAKGGTRAYVLKQASGLALGILTPYLIGIGIYLFGRNRDFVVASIGSFWIGPALFAFIFLSAIHMDFGMRTIIEDYVHGHLRKLALLLLNSAFTWLVCVLSVFAILRMMFDAAQQ